jgi:dTDP-glucose 4,6-dehydratase
MKLLVTGHLGFIGSAFCHLFKDKYEIIGVDFHGFGSSIKNLASGISDIKADISNHEEIDYIFNQVKPDVVINFAAESHVDRSNVNDFNFWKSNVLGTREIALQAIKYKVRMVHVSTDEVYGDAFFNDSPWVEESRTMPQNPYSVTKAAAEMLLSVYSRNDLDVVITRGANTIGPRQFREKAIPKAIYCFTHNLEFPLFRTPAQRMWMYVDDHATGIEAALLKGKKGEIYNLAPFFESEEYISNVINFVKEIVGKGNVIFVDDRKNYDLRYWMSAKKANEQLEWTPQYDLESTIKLTTRWYLDHPEFLNI